MICINGNDVKIKGSPDQIFEELVILKVVIAQEDGLRAMDQIAMEQAIETLETKGYHFLHCESEEQSKEIIDMLTHLQTKETELNHIRQFEHELCEFIKSKSAKNENDFEAGMNYAVGYALGTIWKIYEEGEKT